MAKLMTNERVLKAAGVTDAEITTIKTSDATTVVNTLDPIFERLMSYVQTQRVEVARLNNPLRGLEKSYAELNGGRLNGMFQEILVQARDKGANNLYGGNKYTPKSITDPWAAQDYGKEPLQYVYNVNAKVSRKLDYNRDDLFMALKNETLGRFIQDKLAVLESEYNASEYVMENNVLNCEVFQNTNYSAATTFSEADVLDSFIHKVFAMQRFPDQNTQYKRVPFNTTRGTGEYVLIIDTQFAYDFAKKYNFKSYLKPFVFRSEDSDKYGVQEERTRIIEVDSLNPTTLAANAILDPLNMTATTITGGKLIGRIVDFNACKFGMGLKSAVSFPLDARTSHYDSVQDYCIDMCPAYVNVPLIISNDFDFNRKIYTVDATPASNS